MNPKLEVSLKDRGDRKLDDWERERIKYHYKVGINNPSFGIIIETSEQTPQQTAEEILKLI